MSEKIVSVWIKGAGERIDPWDILAGTVFGIAVGLYCTAILIPRLCEWIGALIFFGTMPKGAQK